MKQPKTKVLELQYAPITVWTLIGFIVVLCGLYIYFMNGTVFTVAKRVQVEQKVATRSSGLSRLEFTSIAMRNNIDIDLAYSLGYTDIQDARYISKTPITVARVDQAQIQ